MKGLRRQPTDTRDGSHLSASRKAVDQRRQHSAGVSNCTGQNADGVHRFRQWIDTARLDGTLSRTNTDHSATCCRNAHGTAGVGTQGERDDASGYRCR